MKNKKRILAGILTLLMVFITVLSNCPPITAMAATGEKGDAPIASKLSATYDEANKEFDLQWTSSETGSGDAKYVIEVSRKDAKEDEAVYETVDSVPYAQTYYTYAPKNTGYYTFRVYGKINDTMTEFVYSEENQYVFVALEAPVVTMRQGDASMTLSWTADESRVVSYDVAYCKADLSKRFDDDKPSYDSYTYTTKLSGTTDKTITFTDLDINSYYYFRVTAHASDGEQSVGYANGYFIKNDAKKTFKTINMGTGAKAGTAKGTFGSKVTIAADGSKFADSEDGFTYYYTPISKDENFILTATFTVTSSENADNQSAMGIIATDTVASTADVNFKYFNSITCGACKLIPTTTGGQAIYRVPGVRYVTGYVDSSAKVPYDPSSTLANPPGLRNMVNKYVFTNDKDKGFVNGSTYTFTLRKSNTGYEGTMSGSDGTYVLYDPSSLFVQDSNNMYVGFFAARNITVEVTDMVMTTMSSSSDEAKHDAPPTYLDKSVAIYSPSHATSYDYNLVYRPTFAGTLTIKDDEGNVIVNGEHINAKEYFTKNFTLKKDETTLTATITPDKNQLLEDFSDVVTEKTITVKKYGEEGQTIVVSPSGTAAGTGSEENPLDVYTAVAYAQPGQTILLKNGTYNLNEKLTLERGHNGTADKPIRMIGESVENIVADQDAGLTDTTGVKFNLAGLDMTTGTAIEVGGDYWHLYGIEIYNTPHDVKTVQVSGNHNTVEMVLIHDVGNSGLQISGSSKETIEHWPSYNTILNCEVYNCCDAKMNDADGFAAKLTSGVGNVFKGCISHHNIDDGWDLYAKSTTGIIGAVVIEDCVTYANGILTSYAEDGYTGEGNGFKLGGESMPVDHQLKNSITFENGAKGVTSNSNPNGIIDGVICYNNAAISQAENFSLYTNSAKNTKYTVNNLVSMSSHTSKQDKRSLVTNGTVTAKSTDLDSDINFFWTGKASTNKSGAKATASWFKNTDTTTIIPTRNADGTINMHGLLEPTAALTSAITFDYNALQGTTGNISDISAEVKSVLANAITDENGTPVKVEIVKAPETTLDGAAIDVTGATIKVTYDSGKSVEKEMTKDILNKSIFYYADGAIQTVTVKVAEGVTATFDIKVIEKTAESLAWDVKPAATVSQNGKLNVSGAKLLVKYNNGTSEYVNVSSSMVSLDSSKLGAATATIIYNGLTITHDVTVVEGGAPAPESYTITVTNGKADTATAAEGETVTITADTITGKTFKSWNVVSGSVTLASATSATTTFVMPASDVKIEALYEGDTPTPAPSEGSYVHNFTASGITSGFYTITGSTSDSKGSVTYNGLTLTTCLKMESKTNISFTAPSAGKLTLVFGGTTAPSGKSVKINGTAAKVGSDGTVTVDVAKGAVSVTKGDAINLFYMVYTPDGTTEETHTHNYVSKVTKEATCTEAGVLTYTCTSTTGTCDKKTYTEAIPATGHKFSTEWTIDVAPTDTTPGSKSHHCTVCDAKTDVTEIPATGTEEEPLAISVTMAETDNDITFTAEATGGKEEYTYKFIVYNRTTKTWGLIQNFSSDNTCTWTKGSAGDREFYVDVKDAEGNIVRSEMLNVKMKAIATLTGETSVEAGGKLTLKAQANVGAGCTYKFIIFNPATNQWFKLQDFSANNTITWTAGNDGTRVFYVDVKDAYGNVTRSEALNVTVGTGKTDKLSVKTTVSANTTKVGDKVTFTAEGIGGESGYTYKMVVYNRTTKTWGLVQNFNSNNTITWTAGTAGDRDFYIDVRDAAGNVTRSAVMNIKTK